MQQDRVLTAGLSLAAGFVEAVCFIGLFHTFTTYITGTVMIMIIDLIRSEPGVAAKAVTFGSFFAFTLVWVAALRLSPGGTGRRTGVFLLIEGGLIALFALVGWLFSPLPSADALGTYVVCVFGVLAMSLHSVIFFQLLNRSAPSHFMTGNVTNFARAVVDLLIVERVKTPLSADERAQAEFRVGYLPLTFGSFVTGVAAGTALLLQVGFLSLLVPALLVFVLGVRQVRTAQSAS